MARHGRQRNLKNTPGPLSDEEEERGAVTKCICGKTHTKGLMIQCENCKVWQHCACVDIPDFDACPLEYYCRTCRTNTNSPEPVKSKKSSKDKESSKSNFTLDKKPTTKFTETKPSSPSTSSSKKPTDHKHKTKSLPRVKSNNELLPIKIKLTVPDKEELGSPSPSNGTTKNTRISPNEFTTKRGRKTTKVAYRTFSEEDPEYGVVPPTTTVASSPSPPPSPKPKKSKPTTTEVLTETPSKKKRKDTKLKRTESANVSTNSLSLLDPTGSPELDPAPLKYYLTTKIPTPPHQLTDGPGNDDVPPPSPTILPSTLPLSSLLTRPPPPPPRPKPTSSRLPLPDLRKRVHVIETYVEHHQAHLKEHLKEHLKSHAPAYKSMKVHYAASTKQAKELIHTINEFNQKLDSYH